MNHKIKVLMIVKEFEIQGISEVILSYIEHIDHRRFQVDVLAGEKYDEGNLIKLKAFGGKFWCVRGRDQNILLYIFRVRQIIKQEGYEIVHVHGNSAMITPELIAAMLGGAPVRIAHSHNITCNHLKLDKILHPLFFTLYTNALACSEEAGKWMFKDHSFDVINNGIDLSKYVFDIEKRKSIRDQIGIQNGVLIGHIGCFNEQKNQKRLVEIFEKISKKSVDSKLVFVGDGEKKTEIERFAKDCGLTDRVIFWGKCQSVGALLSAMDIFVFPSLYEGFGLALLEAEVSGLICFTSDKVPHKANITDRVKYLSLSDSDEVWEKEIYAEWENIGNMQDRMNRSNYACEALKSQKYEINVVAKQLEMLYDKMLKTYPR